MFRQTRSCILGNGYTSSIASFLLCRRGEESIAIGKTSSIDRYRIELSSGFVSPLPIFPDMHSTLYGHLNLDVLFREAHVDIGYTEPICRNLAAYEIRDESLAAFMVGNDMPSSSFILGLKQWGAAFLTSPMSEVRRKIIRNYTSSAKIQRIGYSSGFDPYYHFCFSRSPRDNPSSETIRRIDFKNRTLHLADGAIHYERLISTIPIMQLLEYCGFEKPPDFSCHPSRFMYFTHSSAFPANKVIYDCDVGSDVFRVFSISDSVVAAQLAYHRPEEPTVAAVRKRVTEIIPSVANPVFEKQLLVPMSYPTESISDPLVLDHVRSLKEYGILPFGRFGNWEYVDLHELDWNGICW